MSNLPSVRDFMDKTFVTLHESMDVYKAIDVLLDNDVTSAVVVDDDRLRIIKTVGVGDTVHREAQPGQPVAGRRR